VWLKVLDGNPSCAEFWLNRYQGLIGALATLLAGFLAYLAAMSQAKQAERQAIDAKRAALIDQIERLRHDFDTLNAAGNDLAEYVGRFPSEGTDETAYFRALHHARFTGGDVIGPATLAAPDGLGARINTLMTALEHLGDSTKEITSDQLSTVKPVGGEVYNRIQALRAIEKQIRSIIPRHQTRLGALQDELKALPES
jgi:hypothetical protein